LDKEGKKISKKDEIKRIVEDYPHLPNLKFETAVYKKLYKLAKKFYFEEWRDKEKGSPAFNGEKIKATRKGFRHLVNKTFTTNRADCIKRLLHLRNAKKILETTSEIYETKITLDQNNRKIHSHTLLGKLEDETILKVIVRETSRGDKVFLSVFDVHKRKKQGSNERSDESENRA